MRCGEIGERGSHLRIGRDTPGDDQGGGALRVTQRAGGPIDEAIDDRLLERGGDILRLVSAAVAGAQHRTLQAGEGEMRLRRAKQRPGQRHGAAVAAGRRLLHRRTAGKAEAEQFGGLVERLARRVVDGGGEAPVAAEPFDEENLTVAARDEQQEIGKSKVGLAEHRRQRMAFEMVDRDQRLAARQRQPLGGDQADDHAADKPRAGGGGDRIDLVERRPSLFQRFLDQPRQNLDMGARRDLRDDAAERPVGALLPRQPMGEHPPVGSDQRRRGFVAARFNAEDQAHARFPATQGAASTSAPCYAL